MAYNPNFTGRYPKDTYASILNTDGANVYNSTGSQLYLFNITASRAISASHANQADTALFATSASWSSVNFVTQSVVSSSIASSLRFDNDPSSSYLFGLDSVYGAVLRYTWNLGSNSDNLIIANTNSLSIGAGIGTNIYLEGQLVIDGTSGLNVSGLFTNDFLYSDALGMVTTPPTTSILNATSSYANTSSISVSASWAPFTDTGTTLYTASTYPITASWSTRSNWASASLSSSWASSSISSSYLNGPHTGSTFGTSSWSTNSTNAISSSYLNGPHTGSTFGTASFAISASSAQTSSWAINAISASWAPGAGPFVETWPSSVTQSSFDIPVEDMAMPDSGGVTSLISTTVVLPSPLGGGAVGIWGTEPLFKYLSFPMTPSSPSETASPISSYRGKMPHNYRGGLTHSFQYFNIGTFGERPGATNRVYWEVNLFAIPNSNVITNVFYQPQLVEIKRYTQSFAGVNDDSGSIFTITSMFNDPSNYLTPNSAYVLNVIRSNTLETATISSGGDNTNYSSSVGMISSRLLWNAS